MPAHDFDDKGTLVTERGRHDRVQGFADPVKRGVGTNGDVRARHVVVDTADEAHDRERLLYGFCLSGGDFAVLEQVLDVTRPF